jgi:tRNA modification GTPase
VIEVHLDLEGFPVTLLDTAGIRASLDPVELEGVRRALDRAAKADLVLWVIDASESDESAPSGGNGQGPRWLVRNKVDLLANGSGAFRTVVASSTREFAVSALHGNGLDVLLAALTDFARSFLDRAEPALVTRERHRVALTEVVQALDRAISEDIVGREDMIAEELRLGARALGRLTGRVDVEDVLDVIFRDFCIGK